MSSPRTVVYALGLMAAATLALLLIPQLVAPELEMMGIVRTVVTLAFWISFVALVVSLFRYRNVPGAEEVEIEGPADPPVSWGFMARERARQARQSRVD